MAKNGLYPFVSKLYNLVSDEENSAFVAWESCDRFIVWSPSEFSTNVLPKYFKHNNFCSFVRQLNIYGFHKIDSENWIFKHEDDYFQKDKPELLQKIQRRKQKRSYGDTSTSEKSTNSKVVKTEEECQFSSSNKNPDNAMYKPPSYQQPQNPQSQPQDVEYLKVVNDFLVAEVNEIKRRSQTQQATISWLLNEVSKTKEELDSLKMLQKLSNVNSENAILPPDYSSHYFDTNEINRSQEKTNHNSNLYLTNQMLKVDYPYQSRGYYDPDLDFMKNMYSPSSVSSSTQKIENVDEIDEMSYGSMRNFPSDAFEHVPQYPTFDVGQ